MGAQRPIIFAELKELLAVHVSGRVVFPWDGQLDPEDGPLVQVAIGESSVETGESIGAWLHTVPVKIGLVISGPFDYGAAWDTLGDIAADLSADYTLGGTCLKITLTGGADALDVAGDKIMWPHLAATIEYLTPKGAL